MVFAESQDVEARIVDLLLIVDRDGREILHDQRHVLGPEGVLEHADDFVAAVAALEESEGGLAGNLSDLSREDFTHGGAPIGRGVVDACGKGLGTERERAVLR